jgi:hypothetical protein
MDTYERLAAGGFPQPDLDDAERSPRRTSNDTPSSARTAPVFHPNMLARGSAATASTSRIGRRSCRVASAMG